MEKSQDKNIKTKNQIELIKQKYLKKAVNNQNEEISVSTSKVLPQKTILNNTKAQTQKNIVKKSDEAKSIINQNIIPRATNSIEENKPQQKWSMKNFIQKQSCSENNLQKKQVKEVQLQNIKLNQTDPFYLKIPFRFPLQSQPQNVSLNNDPQFSQQLPRGSNYDRVQDQKKSPKSKKIEEKDLSYACMLWKQNPRKCLIYLYCSDPNIQNQNYSLELKSTNPSFPGIVKQLAQQFIFNNNQPLKNQQKQVVYNMALQYFCPSPKFLSDVLLVSLIKIIPNYGFVYCDQILDKIQYYGQKILKLKKYLLKEELQNFTKFLEERIENLRIDGHKIKIQTYIWLLILKHNSIICHQILLTKNLQNEKDLLAILCILQPDGKQNLLSILYLKCVDSLVPLFIRTGILQKVISHLNQIKVPQALYQPVKSLKLKLIKAADMKKDKKKTQEDKSFINFLNQRVGKLKQVLESKVNSKPKSQIYYNNVSCRYEQIPLPNNVKGQI